MRKLVYFSNQKNIVLKSETIDQIFSLLILVVD